MRTFEVMSDSYRVLSVYNKWDLPFITNLLSSSFTRTTAYCTKNPFLKEIS